MFTEEVAADQPCLQSGHSRFGQGLHLVAPVMLLLEAEHLSGLAVGERRFVADHWSGHWHARAPFCQKLSGGEIGSDGVVDSVEDLEAKPVFLQAEMHDLPEIARVNVTSGVALPRRRVADKTGKPIIFARLDNVADA